MQFAVQINGATSEHSHWLLINVNV
jgi:hypothetical protein